MSSQSRTCLVTGATGFIGGYLVKALLERGYTVTALVLSCETLPDTWSDKVRAVEGDIRALDRATEEIGDCDVVYHLAAVVSDWGALQEHVDITVKGTEQAIALALANNAKFVVTTSIAAYGSRLGTGVLTEDMSRGGVVSNYEHCKQMQESVTQKAVGEKNLKAIIVRPGNVYGVGSLPWVHRLAETMKAGNPVQIGAGEGDAGLCHVSNLVDILIRAGESSLRQGEIFNAADGEGITWHAYLKALAQATGSPPPKAVPTWMAKLGAPVLEWIGHIRRQKHAPVLTRLSVRLVYGHSIFSTDRAREQLGYQPVTRFDAAMAELAEAFQALNTASVNKRAII